MTINEAIKECKEYLKPQPIYRTNHAYNSRDVALYTILLELLEREKQREEKETWST
nr:MAG TPA: hypothetical protein [Caudoviricetes sp.]